MKKRFLSVFLVLAMLCSLVPAMSLAASAEGADEISEDFVFSTDQRYNASSEHFTLEAEVEVMWQSGWVAGTGSSIVIEAKDDTNVITAIKAEIYSGGDNYSYVRYSSGEKAETGNVADYSIVSVNNISSSRLEINCDGGVVQFNRITVYYTHDHHNFSCDGVDNGDGTHCLKCTDCDEYGSPVSHSYRPVTKISDNPLTYTAKCKDCPNTIDNFIINNPVSFDHTGSIRYQDVEKGEILKGGTNLKAEYSLGDAKMIVYVDGQKEPEINAGECWNAPQCVKCLDYDTEWFTFDDTILTIWFKTVCDYTLATCDSPSTCMYCGRTVAKATGHKWKSATCTEAKVCIRCGKTEGEALGHNYKPIEKKQDETETTPAIYSARCTRCGYTTDSCEFIMPKYDSTVENGTINVGDILKKGTVVTFGDYGRIYVDGLRVKEVNSSSWSWTSPSCLKCVQKSREVVYDAIYFETACAIMDPTCTDPATCIYCGYTKEAALGHSYGEWTSISETQHQRVCANDASHTETAAHNFDGKKCSVCGYERAFIPTTYTVTFDMNGHGDQIEPQTIEEGNTAAKPADPTAEGYTFDGWYADETCSTVFDFNAAINADTTVYAKWTKVHTHNYTDVVTDPTCTEDGYTTHTCACGDSYIDTYVTATGHNYGAWTSISETQHQRVCANDAAHTETAEHNFDGNKCSDCGYEKTIVPTTYTVTFDMNDHGKQIEDQSVTAGGMAVEPEIPEADGYIFEGWFSDSDCVNAYDFESIVTEDITIYAMWTEDVPDEPEPELTGEWKKNSKGWWYRYSNDTYPADGIYPINDVNYAFNAKGYMITGWYKDVKGDWYHFASSGAMEYGWKKIGGKWYYLDPNTGIMWYDRTEEIADNVYCFDTSGTMITGWYQNAEGNWYHFASSGAREYGWLKVGPKWYYLDPDNGIMWYDCIDKVADNFYCFDASGAMITGWYQDAEGDWNHFASSGARDTATWIGDYYVDCNGDMVTYAYIMDGDKYYWVNDNGKYTRTYGVDDTEGYDVYDQATGWFVSEE